MPETRSPRLRSTRLLAGAAAVAFAAAVTPAVTGELRPGPPIQHRPPSVRVVGRLPAWVAPGAPLRVSGWTGPHARLMLVVGDRKVATTRSGELGAFTLRGRAPTAGEYRPVVVVDGRSTRIGRLLVRPIRLAAVGDITPGEGVSETVAADGIGYPWTSVASVLRASDVATGNLEGVISSRGVPVPDKQYHFRGGPWLLGGAAKVAGIDVLTVANNHSLDYGRDAFVDTLRAARAARIETVGGGRNLAQARRPAIVTRGGLRIALLGYSDVRPLGFDAGPGLPGTAPADPAFIADDVHSARRHADLVVVWFHWGNELQTAPTARQRELASVAFAAGASVVLGSHPHVLQPVERSGHRLTAWSLGNFVFPPNGGGADRTGILTVSLNATGVVSWTLRPATIHGFRPVLDTRAATSTRR
jgi:poly-gamma-glutamate capsule biosynthesis protein CapA/YwtB (metallophosphatase superfamily)